MRIRSTAVPALLALTLCGSLALPQRAAASDGNPGRKAFFRYCASCHGYDGRGNGKVAASLTPKPSDLTQLAKQHGGTFALAEVAKYIDGSTRVAAHGTAEMPVWGTVFAREQSYEQPGKHAQSQIRLIANYLSSIQTR